MVVDILAGLVLLVFAWSGSRAGAMAALYRVGIAGGALILAKLLAKPTANYIIKGVEWSAPYATGLCFLVYFLLILMVLSFSLAAMIQATEQNTGDGGVFDRGVGSILGAFRGAIIVYALLAAGILLTHRLGAKKPMFAFSYDKSWVGRKVITRNIADPEPFPNAYFLRRLVGAELNDGQAPGAVPLVLGLEKAAFLQTDAEATSAIKNSDWKGIRDHRALIELMCTHEFLAPADDYITPRHKVEAEDPSKRFEELKAK